MTISFTYIHMLEIIKIYQKVSINTKIISQSKFDRITIRTSVRK